jgi:hypothetical protein
MKPSSWIRFQLVFAASLGALLSWSSFGQAQTPRSKSHSKQPPATESFGFKYHITTNNPYALLEVLDEELLQTGKYESDDDELWRPACQLPCNRELDANLHYRIGGPGVKKSDPFQLNSEDMDLHVRTGSKASRVVGIVLTPIGGALVTAGTMLWFLSDFSIEGKPSESKKKETRFYAVTTWIAGATALVTGIVLIATSGTSISKQKPATRTTWKAPSSFLSLGSGVWLSPSGVHFLAKIAGCWQQHNISNRIGPCIGKLKAIRR